MRVLTPWITEPPARTGWYNASTERNPETRRWWNGEYWSPPVSVDSPDDGRFERAKITRGESQDGIEWRGLHVDAMDDDDLEQLADALWEEDDAHEAERGSTPATRESAAASLLFCRQMRDLYSIRVLRLIAQHDHEHAPRVA